MEVRLLECLESRCVLSATSSLGSVGFDSLVLDGTVADPSKILVQIRPEAPAPAWPSGVEAKPLGELVSGLWEVTVDPTLSSTIMAGLRMDPAVLYAEPDYQVTVDADRLPNDPNFSSLWGMNNTGQAGGVVDADIDAPQAWGVSVGSGATVIAVIDTGIDYRHPDLAANIWTNTDEIAGNGIDDDRNGYVDDIRGYDFANNDADPLDDNGHGTHVSGTIAAVGNNGVGVAGVLWNAKLMALKFLNASGSGSVSGAVAALNYAVANGAVISNNSWGGGGFSSALDTAIRNARAAGHIFVAAAGNAGANNNTTANYPANYNYDNVVAVAAVDRSNNLASFSNYGSTSVELAAPGVAILSTTPNGTYSTYDGTSMATPHVTGALALVRELRPDWTYRQVIDRVLATVDPLTSLQGKTITGGRLNVGRAVDGLGTPATDATGPRVLSARKLGPSDSVMDGVELTFSEAINAASFTTSDVTLTGPSGAAIPISSVLPVTTSGNTVFNVRFASQSALGVYTIRVGPAVNDLAGNPMNQNQNAINGESPADQYVATYNLSSSSSTTFRSADTPLAIPDGGAITSRIVVSQNLRINDLNVSLNISHTYDRDLTVTLTSPTGQVITLVNRRGGAGDNFSNTVFDDQAATAIALGGAPFSGSYRPETALNVVNGTSAQGTWTLTVRDQALLDVGALNAWSLVIEGAVISQSIGQSSSTSSDPNLAAAASLIPAPSKTSSPDGAWMWNLGQSSHDSPTQSELPPIARPRTLFRR